VGCCIIGAIVFGFIFGLWRRIGALFGYEVAENKANNPALWRLGDSAGDVSATPGKLPLLSPRFAAALAGGALSIVLAFWVVDHAAHIRQEVACGIHKAGFFQSGDNPCASGQAPHHH